MMMNILLKGTLYSVFAVSTLFFNSCNGGNKNNTTSELYPDFDWGKEVVSPNLDWTKNVGAKTIPSGQIFNVADYGLINDSTTLNTDAIQHAIDVCHAQGGGTVKMPAGHFLTGALFIKSNVNFELDKNTVIIASTDIELYPEMQSRIAGIEMTWPCAVINILDASNAMISGKGTIDCKGEVFWNKYWELRKDYTARGLRWIVDYDCKRVRGLLVSNSKNITLKDFTIMRTGFWACQILYSDQCTLDALIVNNNIGGHGPSTDGIDIDSSSNILIENCDVDCNDDNYCLKAGRDADGLRVNRPTENIVIRNCIARKGAGLITCGSETSGSIRNVLGYNLHAYGTYTALRLKSAMNRGGTVENIYMTNVKADSVKNILAADLNWHPSYSYSKLPAEYQDTDIPEHWTTMLTPVLPEEKGYPRFRNVYFSNVDAKDAEQFISASGHSNDLRLKDFYIHNIKASTEKAGIMSYTEGFNMGNIDLIVKDGSQIEMKENYNHKLEIKYQ